jgi:glycosyltransferase involved in cell wall biosynthesis
MSDKIAIYIPAYNTAATLPLVLDRIPAALKKRSAEILVVDNHSEDHTYLVALGYKQLHGVENLGVIRTAGNMGYGGSQKIAYRRFIERGYECVAMLHGDGQYAPELLQDLLDPVMQGEADLLFGSRMQGRPLAGGMPLHRFCGNRFLTLLQNRLLGTSLSEFHSGYRVYSVEALRQIPFDTLSSDFHFDTEIVILMVNKGFRIAERPIPTHYGQEKNYVNVWRYGIDVLVTTATYFLHQKGWRRSRNWARILSALPKHPTQGVSIRRG